MERFSAFSRLIVFRIILGGVVAITMLAAIAVSSARATGL